MKKILFFFMFAILFVSSVCALTIKSVDDVDVVSNDPDLDGKIWIIDLIGARGAEEIIYDIGKEQLKDNENVAENGFVLREENSKNRCDYRFVRDNSKKLYSAIVKDSGKDYFWDLESHKTHCYNVGGYYWVESEADWTLQQNYWCVGLSNDAIAGDLVFEGYKGDIDISLNADGISKEETINNYDKTSVVLGSGDYKAYLKWDGNFVSGEQCESAGDQNVRGAYYNGEWIIIDDNRYTQYTSRVGYGLEIIEGCVNEQLSISPKSPDVLSCINKHNYYHDRALSKEDFYSDNSQHKAQVDDDNAIIYLNEALQYPSLTLKVKATWIKIKIPVAEPQIKNVNPQNFVSDQEGKVFFTINNSEDVDGEFGVGINCENGFSAVGTAFVYTVNANSERDVDIRIQNNKYIEDQLCGNCKLSVYNTEKADVKDETNFYICMSPKIICDEGESRCRGEQYEYCYKGIKWERDSSKDSLCKITECSNDFDCYSPRPYCFDGKCVECKKDSHCDSNEYCSDENLCVMDGGNSGGGETSECEWYQDEVPAGTYEECGLLGWKKLVDLPCETRTYEASCKLASWWLYIGGGLVVLILGVVAINSSRRKPVPFQKIKNKYSKGGKR